MFWQPVLEMKKIGNQWVYEKPPRTTNSSIFVIVDFQYDFIFDVGEFWPEYCIIGERHGDVSYKVRQRGRANQGFSRYALVVNSFESKWAPV